MNINALSFYRSQNVLCQSKFFESAQNFDCLFKNFCAGTKCLWLAQYVNKSLVWRKKFGPAQNILRPVKGQGINTSCNLVSTLISRPKKFIRCLLSWHTSNLYLGESENFEPHCLLWSHSKNGTDFICRSRNLAERANCSSRHCHRCSAAVGKNQTFWKK